MTPRRPSRRHRHDALLRAAQRARLERIARREIEPESLREECFLAMLEDGGRFSWRDFLVPPLVFLIERDEEGSTTSAAG